MSRKNRNALADRVVKAVDAALAAQGYMSPIDALVGIGWLDIGTVERWRRGQIDCLERAVHTNLPRISEAMKLLRSWARERNLSESPAHYVATATPGAALQPKWGPCDRGDVPDPLGFKSAFREETRTFGRKSHLPFPGFGHVVREGSGYRWLPADWRWTS
jgi:hypothetical protein